MPSVLRGFPMVGDTASIVQPRSCFLLYAPPYGTTTTPMLAACAITLLASPSKLKPLSRVSLCLIFAISYTCLRLIVPTVPTVPIPVVTLPFLPVAPSLLLVGPGTLPAPRILLFLEGFTPAAARSSEAVGGLRSSKVKDLSGLTVTRAGIGVPGFICAVLALNS